MAKRLDRKVYIAINRAMTPSFDRWAKRNHGISGKKLLAKVASAEGGGTTQHPNVSSAGARGPFQFIPSTRASYKAKYGLDAWRTNTEAAKAAMIHLKGTGIAGYNPGMPSYTKLVLGQDVDTGPLKTGKFGGSGKLRGGRVVGGSPGKVSVQTEPGELPSGTGVADLLRQLRAEEGPPRPQQSSPLRAPEFSARAALPTGYQPVDSGGGPQPERQSLSDLLRGVSELSGGTVDRSTVKVSPGSDPVAAGGGGVPMPRGKGKLLGAPIDRPGVKTNKHVVGLVKRASAFANTPVQLGTGSRHNQFSVSGNESAHWRGNALDLPARGRQGTTIARSLLVQLGFSRKRARQFRSGSVKGTHQGRRFQLIWNTPSGSAYGDHTDHVHIQYG